MRRLTAGLAGFAMLAVLAACADPAGQGAPPAGGGATPDTVAGDRPATVKQRAAQLSGRQLHLAVYYLRSYKGHRYLAPEWHPVPSTRAVAAAALGELLDGEPLDPDSRPPFPAGARLRGVRVEAGTATVDLSAAALPPGPAKAHRWPLQALVLTLTQFPTVDRVVVRVGGKAVGGPLTRDPGLPVAPIALAEPAAGALVKGGRLVVRGEASVFEGTVGLRLLDDQGQVMTQAYATAARGAPGRGPFSGSLSFTAPATSHAWTLEAFEVSPEDGAVTYAVQVPLWVGR